LHLLFEYLLVLLTQLFFLLSDDEVAAGSVWCKGDDATFLLRLEALLLALAARMINLFF
jgi:hypothetical protein